MDQRVARRAFGFALVAHLLAAASFLVLDAADLEGCDQGDGAAAALALAIVLDLVLAVTLLVVLRRRHPGERRQVLLGWAAALIPAVAGVVVAYEYVGSFLSGCP
ncbi:hypothetical protein [Actinoplanes regularis]|uniref:hypothetical protein n=1 Tax=Actinoplanes regularis TaxID=52697 RepID=UPI0025573A74|nr:hypothetical protein [Actinoplanes regularis]